MGVYRHDYILIGAKVDTKVCTEDFFESGVNDDYLYERKHRTGEIVYLYDGYSGEYFIVGIPLQVNHEASDGLEYFEFDSIGSDHFDYIDKVHNHVKEKFGEFVEPKLIVLSHYT